VSVSVASPFVDPNSANNTASAKLTVTTLKPNCTVPNLRGVRLPLAKKLLHLLACTVRHVRHVHNGSVGKGHVIRTNPHPGTYTSGHKVTLIVSSGPRH
jgi:beta-lactam-binding protein with PASTA domain